MRSALVALAALSVLVVVFFVRLQAGLAIGLEHSDAQQVYAIGLKAFTLGVWPYFGADVVGGVQTQGALQGLLIQVPLMLWPVPEAPYYALNAISLLSVCVLGWYCRRQLPEVPAWVVWGWMLTAPWLVFMSTHVYNPSYVLAGSVAFFVAAFELHPTLRTDLMSPAKAYFVIGFAIVWIMQLHMSYVILAPYLLWVTLARLRSEDPGVRAACGPVRALGALLLGAAVPGILLVPTYWEFGLVGTNQGLGTFLQFNPRNVAISNLHEIPGRFLSFASYEIPRFLGGDTAERLEFLKAYPWAAPSTVLLLALGLVQPVLMLVIAWKDGERAHPGWPVVRALGPLTIALLYAAFAVSSKRPHAHTFYVLLPVATLFAFHCWSVYLHQVRWRVLAAVLIVSGAITDVAIGLHYSELHRWSGDRARIEEAIAKQDYRHFVERHSYSRF